MQEEEWRERSARTSVKRRLLLKGGQGLRENTLLTRHIQKGDREGVLL